MAIGVADEGPAKHQGRALSLHGEDAPPQRGQELEGLEAETELAQQVQLDRRQMQGLRETGCADGVEQAGLQQGLCAIESEVRAHRHAQQAPDLGPPGDEVVEALEDRLVGGVKRFRISAGNVLWRYPLSWRRSLGWTAFDQQQLILADDPQQRRQRRRDLDLGELAQLVDGGQCGASQKVRDHRCNVLAPLAGDAWRAGRDVFDL